MLFQYTIKIKFKKKRKRKEIPMAFPKCRGDLGSCHRAGAWEAVGPKAGVCGARELLRGCQQGTGPWTWGTRATVHGPNL